MTLLAPSPDMADHLRALNEAHEALARDPHGLYAFVHEATIAFEEERIAALVQRKPERIRQAELAVRERRRGTGSVVLRMPVCPRCNGTRIAVIGIDPSDWTGGTELMGDCPECVIDGTLPAWLLA